MMLIWGEKVSVRPFVSMHIVASKGGRVAIERDQSWAGEKRWSRCPLAEWRPCERKKRLRRYNKGKIKVFWLHPSNELKNSGGF